MTRPTATLLLGTLALGAILWIALGGSASDVPPDDAPAPAAAREATPDAGLHADAGALRGSTDDRGPLVVVIRSEVPDVLHGGTLLVKLRSEESGGNALITTRRDGASVSHMSLPWEEAPEVTRGDDDLRVAFPGISRGTWSVEVSLLGPLQGKASAPPAEVEVAPNGAEVLIELSDEPSAAHLRVHVVQGERTISDARIEAWSGALRVLDLNTRDVKHPEARVLHEVPAEQDLDVRVSHYRGQSLFGKLSPKQVRLAPGESRDLVFEVPRGQRLRVQPVSAHGEKVQAGLVLWRRDVGRLVPIDVMDGFWPQKKGWDGVLPAGPYRAMVTPGAHYARAMNDFDVELQDEPLLVEIRVGDDGIRVTLTLEAGGGGPLGEAQFNLNRITEDPNQSDFFTGRTDEHGVRVSRPLLPGRYRLYLWRHNLAREIDVQNAEAAYTFRLPPNAAETPSVSISGVVTYPDGSRAGGLYVHARPDKGEWERTGRCDGDGRFEIKGLEPGAYDVFAPVRLLDQKTWRSPSRRVVLGTTPATLKIRLEDD